MGKRGGCLGPMSWGDQNFFTPAYSLLTHRHEEEDIAPTGGTVIPVPNALILPATTRHGLQGRKNQKKYCLLFLSPPARSTPGIRPHLLIRRSQAAEPPIDPIDPCGASVLWGFDLVVASSREEEMKGAEVGHHHHQQRLRQQQQALLMQQQQYQSDVLAVAAAAAMTQVILPNPLFLICCFVCALGGSNAHFP
jgi:hypothetical protein